MKKRTTIYLDDELWQKFLEICKREGTPSPDRRQGGGSLKLEEWISQYVSNHALGNPQQRLDVITELGKPFRADACLDCGGKPFVKAQKGKRVFLLCKPCFRRRKVRLDGWKEIS